MLKYHEIFSQKSLVALNHIGLLLCVFLLNTSCQQAKPTEPSGRVQVQIPLQSKTGDQIEYQLQNVFLEKIESLKHVRGDYAHFYYSPGLKNNMLDGGSPVAFFIETVKSLFIPKDDLSMQMATLYYHFQSLAKLSQSIGLGHALTVPAQVAVQAKVLEDQQTSMLNNAFFDGRSKAFVFVRYTLDELPISVNGGIIAHEYFHSIFYNLVYEKINKTNLPIAQKIHSETSHQKVTKNDNITPQDLFNETFLRALNEGFADYWGWIYTSDSDFLKWSLSGFSKTRVLSDNRNSFWNHQRIENEVTIALMSFDNPSSYLGQNVIYNIGTGYARFLKQFTEIKSQEQNLNLPEAKLTVARLLIEFLKTLPAQASQINSTETFDIFRLFHYINQNSESLSFKECDLLKEYISQDADAAKFECTNNNNSYKVIKK